MRLNHFARRAGILALGVVIEIAPPEGGQMKQCRERDQGDKKCMAQRRWRQCRRIKQRVLNAESAGAGSHRANR